MYLPEIWGNGMQHKIFFEKRLPLYLLGLLLLIALVTVFTQARNYGLTTDEAMHDSYGRSTLRWYITLGKDRSFLTYPPEDYEPEHGAIFDVVVAAAQHVFHNQWDTEAIITGLTGVLGVVAIALCGFELGGWWFAFLAALSLWLYPRYFGAIFNNPKDIPFATANTFVLWSVLRLLKRWGKGNSSARDSFLLAFFLAVAVSLRANAVVWYGILALIAGGWWLLNARRASKEQKLAWAVKQQIIAAGIIAAGSLFGTVLLWPYVFLNPFTNLYRALVVLAKYPWNGSVLYQGKLLLAVDLPRTYAFVWLVIGSPPVLILLSGISLLLLCGWSLRKRALDPLMSLVVLAFVVPLGMIVGFHSVLYNGLRQFLFLVPPLILLAVYALQHLFAFCWRRKHLLLVAALALLTVGGYAWTAADMLVLHPYEYVYFSPLVGGVAGANGEYEMDYWNTCQKAASQWLGQNYRSFVTSPSPTVQDKPIKFQYLTFLPANFRAVKQNPDFLIDIAPFTPPQSMPQYQLIHTESVEGVPLCKVYVNTYAQKQPIQPFLWPEKRLG